LSELGDPRFDPDRFFLPADDFLGFVRIPTDPGFRIGTRKASTQRIAGVIGIEVPDNEINDIITPTPEFFISRFPVTVAQFRAFVEAAATQPGDPNALCDPDNRPVRYVDWQEAVAYCEWLTMMLAAGRELDGCEAARLVRDDSWNVTLPSELEWERAARWLTSGVFPWGDTPDRSRANSEEARIGTTSTVGCFPANGLGLYDMIGNVWEWTRSRYDTYPYRPGDDRENPKPTDHHRIVVRGGSWGGTRTDARCASRGRVPPGRRGLDLGFRVVLRTARGS
jgi:formylglycine-generating enzyme required for sulfatase activity